MKKISFKASVLWQFTFLLLFTVLSIALSFYYGSKKITLEMAEQVTKQFTDKVIERTINYLNVPAIQTKPLSGLAQHQKNIMDVHEEFWKYMWEQLLVLPQIQTMFIADAAGSYIQVRREPNLATRFIDRSITPPIEKWFLRDESYNVTRIEKGDASFDPRTRPWYQNTQTQPRIYWTDVYIFTTAQTPGISATYPVLDDTGKLIAVTCVNTPLHSLSDFITEQKLSKHGVVLIVNGKGELVAYPDKRRLTHRDEKTGQWRLVHVTELEEQWITRAYHRYVQTREEKFSIRSDGKNYLVNIASFPDSFISDWRILVVIPKEDLLSSVYDLFWQVGFVSLGIFGISIILVYFFAVKVTQPITQLAIETEKIKNLHLDEVRSVQSGIKEIDMMNRTLISTTQSLHSFRKYVPADLVRQLIQLGQEAKLGGEEAELTIMFSDIQGFTSISEDLPAQKLMLHLSEYLENLTHIIMQEHGTIDKYIGDGIMAFWGAPVKLPNATYCACKAVLACQKRLQDLNIKWSQEGKPELHTRIGLHTGNTVVGNLGSDDRMNYTIIGDSVNLASRLEGANKLYGTNIIISEATYQQVAKQFHCRLLDIVAVKGKRVSVKIYELIAEKTTPLPEEMQQFCAEYAEGLEAYLRQDWGTALAIFKELQKRFPTDESVQLFISRCHKFQHSPDKLPPDWNGVATLEDK